MEKPCKIDIFDLPEGMTIVEKATWNKCCTLYDKYLEEREVDVEKIYNAFEIAVSLSNSTARKEYATVLAEALRKGEL